MAAEHGVRLLVFPELSLTGYERALARANAVSPDDRVLYPLRQLAERTGMTVVAGAPIRNGNGELNIAAFAFRPDGSASTHTKQHLHPGEETVFTAGLGGPTLTVEGATIALAICADTSHPLHAANAAARGAQVYAAGVLIGEKGYATDAALLKQYAMEHRMAVLLANYSGTSGGWVSAGKSAIWSEDGAVVAASAGAGEALVIGRKRDGQWDGAVLPVP
jgi:predicted amidohydrolase